MRKTEILGAIRSKMKNLEYIEYRKWTEDVAEPMKESIREEIKILRLEIECKYEELVEKYKDTPLNPSIPSPLTHLGYSGKINVSIDQPAWATIMINSKNLNEVMDKLVKYKNCGNRTLEHAAKQAIKIVLEKDMEQLSAFMDL